MDPRRLGDRGGGGSHGRGASEGQALPPPALMTGSAAVEAAAVTAAATTEAAAPAADPFSSRLVWLLKPRPAGVSRLDSYARRELRRSLPACSPSPTPATPFSLLPLRRSRPPLFLPRPGPAAPSSPPARPPPSPPTPPDPTARPGRPLAQTRRGTALLPDGLGAPPGGGRIGVPTGASAVKTGPRPGLAPPDTPTVVPLRRSPVRRGDWPEVSLRRFSWGGGSPSRI